MRWIYFIKEIYKYFLFIFMTVEQTNEDDGHETQLKALSTVAVHIYKSIFLHWNKISV